MKMQDEIQELLNSGISAYAISKGSGVSQSVITRLRSRDRKIEKLTIETGQRLLDYWKQVKGSTFQK